MMIISKKDVVGKLGFSSYEKWTTVVRMLAYGVVGDFIDDRMIEST